MRVKLARLWLFPTAVYAEHAISAEAVAFEVKLDVGDDTEANSWGPGLALLADGKAVASLVMRPHSQQFEYAAQTIGKNWAENLTAARPLPCASGADPAHGRSHGFAIAGTRWLLPWRHM